jgi:uncharacterized SAM-binding protein YcdF (DUF218 family)
MSSTSEETTLPGAASCSCCAILRRGALTLLAIVVLLGVAAWFAREPLLRAAADMWIMSDPPVPADAVAIFGGGLEDRPFAAAAYYRQGLVKKVLLSNVGLSRATRLGALESHVQANREVLLRLGVPEGAIEVFGANLSNTREEAVALREWAEHAGARSVIVPTELFTTRRLHWILHHVFAPELEIRVPALDPGGYRRDDWWKHEAGLINFQNEVLKYLYYRLNY